MIDIRSFLFHWSLLLTLNIFRFNVAQSFENLCRHDWLLWTLIMQGSHTTQWRHSCTCPLIDNRHQPITVRIVSQLLYNHILHGAFSKQCRMLMRQNVKNDDSMNLPKTKLFLCCMWLPHEDVCVWLVTRVAVLCSLSRTPLLKQLNYIVRLKNVQKTLTSIPSR